MLKKLTIIFLLISNVSFAQNRPVPTQFDSFILKPTIEWACYADDYFQFEKYNLNKLLFYRFVKNEIQASFPTFSGTYYANHISYITKDSLDKEIINNRCCIDPIYDSNGNTRAFDTIEPLEIDTSLSTFTDVPQILYIENGILKSYIPWVSPSIVKVATAQTKQFVGYDNYLSTCYNYKYNYLPKENNNNIFLGKTTRGFNMDSTGSRSRLKELYGRNLLETIWPYIWKEKLDVFTLDSQNKLKPEEFSDSILSKITLGLPENYYDPSGKLIQYKYLYEYWGLENFKEMQIVQDWYYNQGENIVFNKIRELYLCAKKWTAKGEDKEPSPILKIVFK